jgi:hypothetical protein
LRVIGRIEPSKSRADVILPRGAEVAAIDLVALGIWDDLNGRLDAAININNAEDGRKSSLAGINFGSRVVTLHDLDLERFYDPL